MKQFHILLAGVLLATSAMAQPASEAPKPGKVVTRTYNVSDLITPPTDYAYDSALIPPNKLADPNTPLPTPHPSKSEPGSPKDDLSTTHIQMPALAQLLQKTVQPDSWRDAGGTIGDVRPVGPLLVVTQTESAQQEIQSLLNQIRHEYGPVKQVSVRVRWLSLDPDQAHSIATSGNGAVDGVDESSLSKLGKGVLWAAGQTACFSGQTVFVASGRGRTVVTSASPVVGTQAALYSATGQLLQSGAVLQINPVLSPDGKSVVLDLSSVASNWGPPGETVAPVSVEGMPRATTRSAVMGIDRLNLGVQQMQTTVRIPVGKPFIIGGMTLEPGTVGADADKQLYLVAEVHAESD